MRRVHTGLIVALAIGCHAGGAGAQGAGFDGTYRPPSGGVTGNSVCGTTRFGYPIRVKDGMATMQTVSVGLLEGRVGPDGSINITAGRAVLAGKITGGHFAGTYSVGNCAFNLQYDKG